MERDSIFNAPPASPTGVIAHHACVCARVGQDWCGAFPHLPECRPVGGRVLWAHEQVGTAFSSAPVPLRCWDLQPGVETKAPACDDPRAPGGSAPWRPGREAWSAWRWALAASPERALRFSRGLWVSGAAGAAVWARGGSTEQGELPLVAQPGDAPGGSGLRRVSERLGQEMGRWRRGGLGPGRGCPDMASTLFHGRRWPDAQCPSKGRRGWKSR